MDKQLKPKRNKLKWIFISLSIGLIALTFMAVLRKKHINLKQDTVIIKQVKKGIFEDIIIFNSKVVPKNSVFVNVYFS